MNAFADRLERARQRPGVITLLTDFGLHDGFVGVMKGVILCLSPDSTMIDITHDLPRHAIRPAAFLLRWAYGYFPVGTVHLAVVDPGVGTERNIIGLEASGHTFLAPDNGLLYPLWEELCALGERPQVRCVTNRSLCMERVSPTFHGRDVFAPLAAHLASGTPFDVLGPVQERPTVELSLPGAREQDRTLHGEVVYVDRFGNLITSLGRLKVESFLRRHGISGEDSVLYLGDKRLCALGGSYGSVETGGTVVTFDGYDFVEIAVNRDSAKRKFSADVGVPVRLEPR